MGTWRWSVSHGRPPCGDGAGAAAGPTLVGPYLSGAFWPVFLKPCHSVSSLYNLLVTTFLVARHPT